MSVANPTICLHEVAYIPLICGDLWAGFVWSPDGGMVKILGKSEAEVLESARNEFPSLEIIS